MLIIILENPNKCWNWHLQVIKKATVSYIKIIYLANNLYDFTYGNNEKEDKFSLKNESCTRRLKLRKWVEKNH